MINNNIYPCFWFNDNASAAANFYLATFPQGKLVFESDIVKELEFSEQKIMLLQGGPQFKPNPSLSMMVLCDTVEEAQEYWNKLSLEGKVLMPLDSYPWSKKYGWVEDKFGVSWQIYFSEKRAASQKYVPSLMYMGAGAGKADDAIHCYTKLFPDSHIQGILKYGAGMPEPEGNVQHGQFAIDNYTLMAMDNSAEKSFHFDEGASLVVVTKDQDETDKYWNALTAEGGSESECGWLKDKYGLSWQIVPRRMLELLKTDKADKAMAAMRTMKKIEIDQIESAVKE